ncbi:hypothetical protein CCHR01_08582 [Colletotrichum chrysophilum]|uniref:DUF6604 domain-containing protein n=1 Tax=Colletotrichum chrysophilum TaxID=1836956 RepID=A0AAD9AJC6_9PEZI|nr:hypothetical protein CCHR01_08582 [Colletotrichum chrysophilum]
MEVTLDMITVQNQLKLYKSSSNCFLRWLWCAYHQADPRSAAGVKPFRNTRNIKVSRTVRDAGQSVPGSVLGALRDAIRFRKMVTQSYESSGSGDSGHRYFVKRLEQTLAILQPLETQDVPFEDYVGRQEDAGPRSRLEQQNNKFASLMEGLNISPHSSPPRASNSATPAAPTSPSPSRPESEAEPKKPEEFVLDDDDIGVAYDAARFLVPVCNIPDCPDQFRTPPSSEIPRLENFLTKDDQKRIRDLMGAIQNHQKPLDRGISVVEMIKGNHLDGFVDICEAFFDFGQAFLLQKARVAHGEMVVAMSIILQIEAATLPYPHLRGSACRAQGLRFALDVTEALTPFLKAVQRYHPSGSIFKGLQTLLVGLQVYKSDEKLASTTTLPGLTTLHLYNALRIRGFDEFQIPQIPVLDELSGMFLQGFFLGTVPKHKFLSSFRLAVYNSHRMKRSETAQFERGLDLLSPSNEATYWGLCDQHYTNHRVNGIFLCKMYKTEEPGCDDRSAAQMQANIQKVNRARDLLRQDTWSGYASKSLEAVLSEVQGSAPIARVNFFELFGYC